MGKKTQIISSNKNPVSVYFCIFILFLTSMELWIAWNGRSYYINFFVGLCLWILIKINCIKLIIGKKNVYLFIILLLSYVYLSLAHFSINGIVAGLLGYLFPVSLIIFLNDEDRVKCLGYIVKWFAILMIPAMITYLLCQTIGLPSLGTLKLSDNPYQPDSYLFKENYFFCTMYSLKETVRFNGPFNEPGHLGMMSAFLLFADGYKFNKSSTWVILLALLMTLSLSGYVLAFFGFLFVKYNRGKLQLKFIILFLLIFLFGYLFVTFYNGGDNIINERIVSRLEPDEERGIAGNNRVFGDIHLYYLDMFNDTRLVLFGYDRETIDWLASTGSRGTGMEMFMVANGVVGIFLSLSFYFFCFLFRKPKKAAALYFLFVFLLLLQRSYWFWFSWIICYLYGFNTWNRNQNQKKFSKHPCKVGRYHNSRT